LEDQLTTFILILLEITARKDANLKESGV